MKITVAGVGYVGLSLAVLLAQHNEVTAVTTTPAKAELINSRLSPIQDKELEEYLREKELRLTATCDREAAYRDAELVIIATPTNYEPKRGFFDTSAVEDVIRRVLAVNPDAYMVIKSTVPVGYTASASVKPMSRVGTSSSSAASRRRPAKRRAASQRAGSFGSVPTMMRLGCRLS